MGKASNAWAAGTRLWLQPSASQAPAQQGCWLQTNFLELLAGSSESTHLWTLSSCPPREHSGTSLGGSPAVCLEVVYRLCFLFNSKLTSNVPVSPQETIIAMRTLSQIPLPFTAAHTTHQQHMGASAETPRPSLEVLPTSPKPPRCALCHVPWATVLPRF